MKRGSALIEVLVTLTVGAIIFVTVFPALYYSIAQLSTDEQRSRAHFLSQDAIEAVKNIRDRNWEEIAGAALGDSYHPFLSSGEWSLQTDAESIDQFTRDLRFVSVCRDATQAIVDCATPGSIVDTNVRSVLSRVLWSDKSIANSLEFSTYITNLGYLNTFISSFSQTNQQDFEAGTPSYVDTQRQPGTVRLEYATLHQEDFESYEP